MKVSYNCHKINLSKFSQEFLFLKISKGMKMCIQSQSSSHDSWDQIYRFRNARGGVGFCCTYTYVQISYFNKSYLKLNFMIFDNSNRFPSLKNLHLDTTHSKIGLKTPILPSNKDLRVYSMRISMKCNETKRKPEILQKLQYLIANIYLFCGIFLTQSI